MRNAEVAGVLYNISELLEIKGENIFKIRAYAKAAHAVEGTTEDIEEIHKLNETLSGFHVFSGIEVDIKADASLDFPDSILRQCDVVVAALHTGQRQTRREITGRLITAMLMRERQRTKG